MVPVLDGRRPQGHGLFAFYAIDDGASSAVGELDPATGALIANDDLSSLPQVGQGGGGWAFGFWGGQFYLFTTSTTDPALSSIVTNVRSGAGAACRERPVWHAPGVRSRLSVALVVTLVAWMASACSTSSGGPDAGDASEELPSCNGACEAGTTCQGYSVEGYCADYYCAHGAWLLATGCPAGMSQTPSLTTSCGQGCFGISICTYNNVPPATDVCCCPATDAPTD